MTTATATYTKLKSGQWGVRIPNETVRPGAEFVVTTKAGAQKREVVERVLWHGNGVSICAIRAHQGSADSSFDRRRKTFRRRYGWDGVEGSPSYYSSGLYDEES